MESTNPFIKIGNNILLTDGIKKMSVVEHTIVVKYKDEEIVIEFADYKRACRELNRFWYNLTNKQ